MRSISRPLTDTSSILESSLVFASSFIVLALALPIHEVRDAIYLLALTVAAVLPFAMLSRCAPRFPRVQRRTWIIPAAVNVLALYTCLRLFGSYNNVLIFGVFALSLLMLYALLIICSRKQLLFATLCVNVFVVVAIISAAPHVNGLQLTMDAIRHSTHIGAYRPGDEVRRRTDRHERYHHAARQPQRQVDIYDLRTPVAGHRDDHVNLLLRPLAPVGFHIREIEVLNYLGFDARRVEKLSGEDLSRVRTRYESDAGRISVDETGLSIESSGDFIWLAIPINAADATRLDSPARRGNGLRAVFWWQIIWLLCMALAPRAHIRQAQSQP
jgi:hypothetical protein